MATFEHDDTEVIIDKTYLGKLAAARYEAESFLQLHANDYFATGQNGAALTRYLEERSLPLTVENFEHAFKQLKATGELLPGREAVAAMSTEEFQQFAKEHGTPRYDGFGRLAGYDLPDAYKAPTTPDYSRPRQSSTLDPVRDPFPQDEGKTFTARQLAGFSADRYRAYCERTGQWGK